MIYGTRPEAVKVAPVVIELRRCGVEPAIIQTGQHTSLLKGTPAENVLTPNVTLALASTNDPLVYARECGRALAGVLRKNRPDIIVVQGDTASAYAGACVGKYLEIPVAHVEAGIRTGDPWDPWPEENFRVSIDQIATQWFCATEANHWNLNPDPGGPNLMDRITGNTGIDALYSHTRPVEYPHKVQDRVLITLHRRESFGEPLAAMIRGVYAGATKYPKLEFIWPSHPNPRVQGQLAAQWERIPTNLIIQGPLEMIPFAKMLASSRAVITDSGGVQEEAAALGVPCIVAREKTDRPESVALGLAKVVGRTEQGILDGLDWALGFGARCTPSDCFGDGKAAPRIVEHLVNGAKSERTAA